MSKKGKKRDYTTVSIPINLAELIDEIIVSEKGYKNRPDFVVDAIRKRLRELGFLK